jgi:hypothetical protein
MHAAETRLHRVIMLTRKHSPDGGAQRHQELE